MYNRIFFEPSYPESLSSGTTVVPTTAGRTLSRCKVKELRPRKDPAAQNQLEAAGTKLFCTKAKLSANRVFSWGDDERSKVAMSAYKALRTQVLRGLAEAATNSFMVSGPTKDVGKTLTSINLALALARQQERTVVLVDLDLRSPSLASVIGFQARRGIGDIAEGHCELNDVLIDPGLEGLLVLPGSKRYEDSSELLMSHKLQALFQQLADLPNSIIVYDTPPILGCDDVAAVCPMLKACLMVVRENMTSRAELKNSLKALGSSTKMLGVTVNRSSEADFASYYY